MIFSSPSSCIKVELTGVQQDCLIYTRRRTMATVQEASSPSALPGFTLRKPQEKQASGCLNPVRERTF